MAKRLDMPHSVDSPISLTAIDRLTQLFMLWHAFERYGTISAYITYRMHLSRLIRHDPGSQPPPTGGLSF
ncbi:MAG: hypothetical protein ACRDFA_11695 [bacterium]